MAEQINVTQPSGPEKESSSSMGIVLGIILLAVVVVLFLMFRGNFGGGEAVPESGTDTGTGASSELNVDVGTDDLGTEPAP
ncbi:MAG: hypothetical protein WD200_04170 [Candidatus Andersenbacteria bacterium]